MNKQLRILAGMAVVAALALAGALGVVALTAAQPVQAQANPVGTATRAISAADSDGNVTVTITIGARNVFGSISETFPEGYTYVSGGDAAPASGSRTIAFTLAGESSVEYMLTPPTADGTYNFMGTMTEVDLGGGADVVTSIGGTTYVMIGGGNGGNGMPMADSSVEALPNDPGAAAQITVKFSLDHGLDIDESIVIEVDDNTGVPSAIAAGNVSIADGTNTASPRSVVVEVDDVAERYRITLFIGDMSDVDGAQDLESGNITVTIRQEAGVTNRTEGGSDDWFYRSSREDDLTEADSAYTVPFLVELSSYGDARGEEITAVGKGFKNGTTVRFWRDASNMGTIDPAEVTLCSATASGDDIAECTFTLSNPPFVGGTAGNYINAVDGRNNKANTGAEKSTNSVLPVIELEPSMSASPEAGSPGDNVNVQLYDFIQGDTVSKIDLGRSFDVCGGSSNRACPGRSVGDDGGLSFVFEIPNGVTPGIQQLRVFAGPASEPDARDVDTNFVVGLGQLNVGNTDVLPNQRISVSASGFTTSQGGAPAYIGSSGDGHRGCPTSYGGAVTLGGTDIPWTRVSDGDDIEITSGGTWSGTIDLPVNALTTVASTRELKVIDCKGGVATLDLTFPAREVTMSPEMGGVGSEVIITGKNFPAANGDVRDIDVTVEYDAGVDADDDDVEPDSLGNWTVILEVPEDAVIPSNNTVSVSFRDDDNVQVLDTFTHRIPQGAISFGADEGAEGSLLTVSAIGFARYVSVDTVYFDNTEVTPVPKPATDTNGNMEFDIRIPGADPGIYIVRVDIDDVVASHTFTVVSGRGVVDGAVDSILANVISEDALDRVFKFDNMTKEWQWYINDPAFASTNNLGGLSSGDLVWIKVSKSVTADILGTSTTLSCINEGMENEDCWNQISIP